MMIYKLLLKLNGRLRMINDNIICEKIVLDTHMLLWSLLTPDNLDAPIKNQIDIAKKSDNL